MKKIISIVTPTYNEEGNIEKLVFEIENIMLSFKSKYDYEHIVIDNKSTDNTIKILKNIAENKKNLKVIINSRNYGHIRSPFYGMLQTKGEAVITLSSDFQDPIELIVDYIKSWEQGYNITLGQKIKSKEFFLMRYIRKFFYIFLRSISNVKMPLYTDGTGIYDKKIIDIMRKINDPYPYLRGFVAEIEEDINLIQFEKQKRLKGTTKNNFFTLYDMAMLGIVKHSTLPLRLLIFLGFISSLVSFITAISYFLYKLIYWQSFDVGIGPIVIGMFFFFSIMILLMGLIGEYILLLLSYAKNLPLVIEKERINFE